MNETKYLNYVKGYLDPTVGNGYELVYALLPDNTVKKCHRKYSNCFQSPKDNWVDTNELPEGLSYIGLYPPIK